MTLLLICSILFLLLASALCSGIETAFTAVSPAKIHRFKDTDPKKVSVVMRLIKIKEKIISTFLIIYSLFNTIATTLSASLFIYWYGDSYGPLVSSVVMSLLIIIFAEVIPKAIAIAKTEKLVMNTVFIAQVALILMKPFNVLFTLILRIFCFIFRINLETNVSAEDEVRGIIYHHHSEGNVQKADKDMIDAVLDITHMSVYEVMVHRSQIKSVSGHLSNEQLIHQALSINHRKIPIWKEREDNIVGVLDIRNLLPLIYKNNFDYTKIDIGKAIEKPWFIHENVALSIQLEDFRTSPNSVAFIVDEYGDLQGLVSIEDILGQIVGCINHDRMPQTIIKGDKYIIDGSFSVREINRQLDLDLSEDIANTVGGLVINILGKIPEEGEKLQLKNIRITVKKKEENKLTTLVIEKKSKDD